MTAEVYTYIGAGGKTTSIFARARQERAAGRRVAVVTTTHMKHPSRWFVPAALPAGWRMLAAYPLQVPGLGAERHLVEVGRSQTSA